MRNAIVIVVGVVALGVATYSLAGHSGLPVPDPISPVACTMEAKLCPDGSYVGRTGPNCEFTACPDASASSTDSAEVQLHIEETKTVLSVSITPTSVFEDSRCPLDVQCIQAGTVRVQTQVASALGTSSQIFTLNKPVTIEAEIITLIGVSPAPYSTQTIGSQDYLFIFEIKKR